MTLTKNQKILMKALTLLGMNIDDICGMFLLLKSEENIQKMITWMTNNIEASEREVKMVALQIAENIK